MDNGKQANILTDIQSACVTFMYNTHSFTAVLNITLVLLFV